jgi:hypothetical protein
MRKFIWILIIAVVVSLTSCGSGSSEEAKELLSQILTIVGIPQDMVVNICQDSDENGLCSPLEVDNISLIKNNFFTKLIFGDGNSYELQNYDSTKNIIMELRDTENIEHNDGNFSLEYKGSILDMLKESGSLLDILIQNDTSVDFSYLNLCVKK